jgi:hypothetical protein
MKKLALILALMLIPCAAFGLEMLDNNAMDEITGQGGVNIAVDDVQLFINIEKMAWIDCDGFDTHEGKGTCGGHGGAIALNNFQIDVMNINAITQSVSGAGAGTLTGSTRPTFLPGSGPAQQGPNLGLASTSCGSIPLFYNYATATQLGCGLSALSGRATLGLDNYTGALSDSTFTPHFLSIDVTDALPASSEGLQFWATHAWSSSAVTWANGDANSTIGGVLIGFPTVEIYIQDMVFEPLYDGDITNHASTAINDDSNTWTSSNGYTTHASFGTIQMHGITFTVLGGWMEISPK